MFTTKLFLVTASILAGLSVALGAFASHSLRGQLTPQSLSIFEKAAQYQMYHALALLGVGLLLNFEGMAQRWLMVAGFAFIAGVILFSGSLYALSLSGVRALGIITPVGGVAFLVGWIALAIASFKLQ